MFEERENECSNQNKIGPSRLPVETIEKILGGGNAFSPGFPSNPDPSQRCAAVLVPLVEHDGEWRLLFTRRTETLPDHKGQVAFPGGACEVDDSGPVETAKREAYEEIGVAPSDVRVLGSLGQVVSVTSFLITPIVGLMPWPYPIIPSPEEVSKVFTIPLAWLADPSNREERPFFHPVLGTSHMVIYFAPYEGEVLWGLTARMTVSFLQQLRLTE